MVPIDGAGPNADSTVRRINSRGAHHIQSPSPESGTPTSS
jgi:hypothetical protein